MPKEEVEVLPVATKPTPSAMYAALRLEYRLVVGEEPTRPSLLVLMAQWALETATGAASQNHNVAGIKWTPGCGYNFARYSTREWVNGVELHLQQSFRAYDSLEDGVADYLHVLRHDFAYAWPAVEVADVDDFAHRLKEHHYYTDLETRYAAGLRARYAQLDAYIGPDTQPEGIDVSDAILEVANAVVPEGQPTPPEDLPSPEEQPA